MCVILIGVLLLTVCKFEPRYHLVVSGSVGYCISTGDVGVSVLLFLSIYQHNSQAPLCISPILAKRGMISVPVRIRNHSRATISASSLLWKVQWFPAF